MHNGKAFPGHKTRLALLVTVPVLAAGLSACGHSGTRSAAETTTARAGTSVPAPTTTDAAPPTHNTVLPVPATDPLNGTKDLDCGPVLGTNGQTAEIIAVATSSGVIGCTEAVTIATRYVGTPRTGDAVLVDGWTCEPQPDNDNPFVCFKDGFVFDLRGGGGPVAAPVPPPMPVTTTVPVPTDVNCGQVSDAGGSARTVIAVSTAAGVPGCTDAITVASDYTAQVSTSDSATVDGWTCRAQADPTAGTTCDKDGLVINLLAH